MSAATTPDGKRIRAIRIVALAVVFFGTAVASGYSTTIEVVRFLSMVSGIALGLMLNEQ